MGAFSRLHKKRSKNEFPSVDTIRCNGYRECYLGETGRNDEVRTKEHLH